MIGKRSEYDRMAACERELWWYKCLHKVSIQKLQKYCTSSTPSILDAGCGTGGLLYALNEKGYRNCKGFDLSEDAVAHTLSTYSYSVSTLNILDIDKVYLPNSFDVIISNDVICLLSPQQAQEAFNKLVTTLKPDGLLLLNLPAGKAFAGTHDLAVGIQKRYSKSAVRKLAEGNPVNIKEMMYWPFFLSPLILAVRWFQRLRLLLNKDLAIESDVSLPPVFINSIFYWITSCENKLLAYKPWGSSLFIVFKKRSVA